MKYIIILVIFFIFGCSKQQSILICGDHKCVNKSEAKQYFEDNLTIEVQIISKEKKTSYDLVNLNLGVKEKDIKVFKKNNKKIVKKLSKVEIKAKKSELKNKKKESKLNIKNNKKNTTIAKKNTNLKKSTKTKVKNDYSSNLDSFDICTKLEKCDIDSITEYLIKASKEKDFPNISQRE